MTFITILVTQIIDHFPVFWGQLNTFRSCNHRYNFFTEVCCKQISISICFKLYTVNYV